MMGYNDVPSNEIKFDTLDEESSFKIKTNNTEGLVEFFKNTPDEVSKILDSPLKIDLATAASLLNVSKDYIIKQLNLGTLKGYIAGFEYQSFSNNTLSGLINTEITVEPEIDYNSVVQLRNKHIEDSEKAMAELTKLGQEAELYIDYSIPNESKKKDIKCLKGALSKSDGKPKFGNVFKWLDENFLLEMAEAMEFPVKSGKYPKNNWRSGVGDCTFVDLRLESALRHLLKAMRGDLKDSETGVDHLAHAAVNLMMSFYCDPLRHKNDKCQSGDDNG